MFNDLLKLRRKIQLLREYGLSTEDILKDLFNLGLSEQNLKQRLIFLKANGIEHCLPWMLRGREDAIKMLVMFITYFTMLFLYYLFALDNFRLVKHRQELSPDENQTLDILAKTLKLHGQTARMLFKRYMFIRRLDTHQISSVLEFLLDKFTIDEIVKNIRMLQWTVPELERRILEAKALGIECIDPICLAKGKKQFQKYLNIFANRSDCKFEAKGDTQDGK